MEETLQSCELEKKKSEKLAKKREQQLKDRILVRKKFSLVHVKL